MLISRVINVGVGVCHRYVGFCFIGVYWEVFMLKVKVDRYIYPPRADKAVARSDLGFLGDLGWKAQLKFNDTHVLIKFLDNDRVELWNRHGERLKYYAPDGFVDSLLQARDVLGLTVSPGSFTLLDGGLLDAKHRAIKDTIVIWDILVRDGDYLVGQSYGERYDFLVGNLGGSGDSWMFRGSSGVDFGEGFDFGLRVNGNVFIPRSYDFADWDGLWDMVGAVNEPYVRPVRGASAGPVLEGLMLKDFGGLLERAWSERNNSGWLVRSRVSTGRHMF